MINNKTSNNGAYILGYLVLLVVIGFLIFYRAEESKKYVSYQKVLVQEIDSLHNENKTLDSLYRDALKKAAGIRYSKDKIEIKEDLKKLRELVQELERVQNEKQTPSKDATELLNYFENEIKQN
jgi:iron-sulfur cluster repair protein YtfE (RIC family)